MLPLCSGWCKALCLQPGVKEDDGSDEYGGVDGRRGSAVLKKKETKMNKMSSD